MVLGPFSFEFELKEIMGYLCVESQPPRKRIVRFIRSNRSRKNGCHITFYS